MPAPKHPKHVWTPIAPEVHDECDHNKPATWYWCIRCGCMKLGNQVFKPGPRQKMAVCAEKGLPSCVEGQRVACPLCGLTFPSYRELNGHQNAHKEIPPEEEDGVRPAGIPKGNTYTSLTDAIQGPEEQMHTVLLKDSPMGGEVAVTNKTIPYSWECLRCKTKGVVECPEWGDIYPTIRDAHNKVSPNCRAWDEFVNSQQRQRKS